MEVIDLTAPFYEGMPRYPAPWYPPFGLEPAMTPETDPAGAGRRFTKLLLFAHNATHVDAPAHFFADGAEVAELPLALFVGPACIAHLANAGRNHPITATDLAAAAGDAVQPGDRLLVRTDYFDRHWGEPDFWQQPPYLTAEAAHWLLARQVSLVGLDCLTEKPGDRSFPVHKTLLTARVPILEYLCNLAQVPWPRFTLAALPAKVAGVEAAPVRAVALPPTWGAGGGQDGWPLRDPDERPQRDRDHG